VTAVTRGPRVYRGNPFQVEAALAYGGDMPPEDLATVYRFANRVPLLYQQGACAMTQAVVRANWKTYDVQQSRGALPNGPLLVLVHIASVWYPSPVRPRGGRALRRDHHRAEIRAAGVRPAPIAPHPPAPPGRRGRQKGALYRKVHSAHRHGAARNSQPDRQQARRGRRSAYDPARTLAQDVNRI